MRAYTIHFLGEGGFDAEEIIWAYTVDEAIMKFYAEFPSGCRIKKITHI